MPTPTIPDGKLYFNAKTWSGNSSTQSIPLDFAPDLIWNKSRSAASGHSWWDVIRGTGAQISSNETAAETTGYNAITSFSNNAISLGVDNTGTYNGRTNETGRTYVGWVWKAGGTAVTNTAGTITSQVSANTTNGFSIVTYTGTGSVATIGHGLGVKPSMIFFKVRSNGTYGWYVYNSVINATNHLVLNTAAASSSSSFLFNDTEPTSSVMTVGTSVGTNQSGQTFVAYCWSEVAGFSKFGSYTGNGSTDGPFVYLGFRPRFVMIKNTTSAYDWVIFDTARNTYNVMGARLYPNSSSAESTLDSFDIVSNGFKIRYNGSFQEINASGNNYIYMAFAENPFKYANAR